MSLVKVVMGSRSDWEIMQEAVKVLTEFNIKVKFQVLSAHRTPSLLEPFCKECEEQNISLIIAGAGGAAHLPGMLASFTYIPVIGVPIKSSQSIDGIDSLYSIVQMPKGVPVATVGINNATNAGILAAKILSINNPELTAQLKEYQVSLYEKSIAMNDDLSLLR